MNLKLSSGSGCFKAELDGVPDQSGGSRDRRYEDTGRNEESIIDLMLGIWDEQVGEWCYCLLRGSHLR